MKEIKLNLGCGQTGYPDWVNIDNSWSAIISRWPRIRRLLWKTGVISKDSYEAVWPKNVERRDLSGRLGYPEGSVSKIYSSHMLEHMERSTGENLLKGRFRVLKKGGTFRLVVPDLAYHCRRYLEKTASGESVGREPHDELLFNLYGAYFNKKRSGAFHSYMYDWPTLHELFKQIGFSKVTRQNYREGSDKELFSLDSRPEDSLHVEAIK